jgi:hypothetical protein
MWPMAAGWTVWRRREAAAVLCESEWSTFVDGNNNLGQQGDAVEIIGCLRVGRSQSAVCHLSPHRPASLLTSTPLPQSCLLCRGYRQPARCYRKQQTTVLLTRLLSKEDGHETAAPLTSLRYKRIWLPLTPAVWRVLWFCPCDQSGEEAAVEGSEIMRQIRIEKLIVNCCVGESGDRLTRASRSAAQPLIARSTA